MKYPMTKFYAWFLILALVPFGAFELMPYLSVLTIMYFFESYEQERTNNGKF